MVNSLKERVSLAFFYNPKSDILIEPVKALVTPDTPALYPGMTFDQYRLYIRMRGPRGKSQVESLKSPRWINVYQYIASQLYCSLVVDQIAIMISHICRLLTVNLVIMEGFTKIIELEQIQKFDGTLIHHMWQLVYCQCWRWGLYVDSISAD